MSESPRKNSCLMLILKGLFWMYFIGWIISKLPLGGQIIVTLVAAVAFSLAMAVGSGGGNSRHRGGSARWW